MKRATPIPDIWGARNRADELKAACDDGRYTAWLEELGRRCDTLRHEASVPKTARMASSETSARACAADAEALGWGWLLTGEDSYADAALVYLTRVMNASSAWADKYHTEMYPGDRADLYVSETIKASATALSILDPVLDVEERWRLAEYCCVEPGNIIFEDSKKGCWWHNALNSNWTSVLNSALGFAGIIGLDQPGRDTGCWVETARARIGEMLDLAAVDAGGVEGPSYWVYCFGSAQDFAVADFATGNGSLLDNPFWSKAASYLAYFVLPDFSGWINYGDTPYDTISGSHVFHGIARYCDDASARRTAYRFAEKILAHHPNITWKNLLYDPGVGADSSNRDETHADSDAGVDELPKGAFFESVHLASFRSGWNPDDTLLFVRGGSNAWSHMHLDLGSFVIHARGERLAVDPGPAPYSVHYWHSIVDEVSTRWHNCMVVDGANQRVGAQFAMTNKLEDAGDCYARMFGHVTGDDIDIISVDCTAAYGDYLDRYIRSFARIGPNLVAVFDDCHTNPARVQRNFEWLIHSECPMVDTGDTVVATGKRAALHIHPIYPTLGEHRIIDGKTLPKLHGKPLYCASFRPYWHHKWNVNPAKSEYPHWHPRGDATPLYGNDYRFLNLLVIEPRGSTTGSFSTPNQNVRSVDADGCNVCEAELDDEKTMVGFDPDGHGIQAAGIDTDAAIVVVRRTGQTVEWAIQAGTFLRVDGNSLYASSSESDASGSVE